MKETKKHKIGFTLAETLITLGIIGVIAALTLPALFTNTNRAVNAESIARAKELFEHAMANVIQSANKNAIVEVNGESVAGAGIGVSTLSGIQMKDFAVNTEHDAIANDDTFIINDNNGANLISRTMGLTGIKEYVIRNNNNINYRRSILMFNGGALSNTYNELTNCPVYKFDKSDVVIFYRPISNNIPNNITEDRVLTRIIMDTNGEKAPNRVGQDVFVFGLANNGHLVPAGSSSYNNNIFGENLTVFPNACTNDNVGNGISCAARVMAEGWKINY